MISPEFFVEKLRSLQMDFFTGVPDSLLKAMCAYITDTSSTSDNIIPANEGAAVGLAVGHHLATGRIPVVYMQNSGLGNAVNPLLSLSDKEVYNVPMLLLIGWRGEPGVKDEPQHVKQGKVTLPLLKTMGIEHAVLSQDADEASRQIEEAKVYMDRTGEPFALVIRKGTFENYSLQKKDDVCLSLNREEAIRIVAASMAPEDAAVSTTGMISRELFEFREARNQGHHRDFLTVGSMGHASQIALGIALRKPDKKVFCFDGDGAVLMHMGSMAIIGDNKPANYIHVVFNNGAHDSVGGQPTVALRMDLLQIATACGYRTVKSVADAGSLESALAELRAAEGPVLLEVKVCKGARADLGRPTVAPVENKKALMEFLK